MEKNNNLQCFVVFFAGVTGNVFARMFPGGGSCDVDLDKGCSLCALIRALTKDHWAMCNFFNSFK